jgi:hypothetical protein
VRLANAHDGNHDKHEATFLEDTRKAFRAMVQVEDKKRAAKEAVEKAKSYDPLNPHR